MNARHPTEGFPSALALSLVASRVKRQKTPRGDSQEPGTHTHSHAFTLVRGPQYMLLRAPTDSRAHTNHSRRARVGDASVGRVSRYELDVFGAGFPARCTHRMLGRLSTLHTRVLRPSLALHLRLLSCRRLGLRMECGRVRLCGLEVRIRVRQARGAQIGGTCSCAL